MTFGERMKRARDMKGLKASFIAKEIGVTSSAYSRYEKDQREPTAEMIRKIANVLDVSADFLLNTNKYRPDAILNDTEQQLLEDFRGMNAQGQEYILQTVDLAKDRYIKNNSTGDMEEAK